MDEYEIERGIKAIQKMTLQYHIVAPEGGYCARASNFSVRLSVLSVCAVCPSVAQDELKISKFRIRQKSSFKPETDRESLIFTQKIQVSGRS